MRLFNGRIMHAHTAHKRAPFSVAAVTLASSVAVVFIAVSAFPAAASPGQATSTLRTESAADVANMLAGNGVTISDASSTGNPVQVGSYSGVNIGQPSLTSGVAISSGSLIDADPTAPDDVDFTYSSILGPNKSLTNTGDLGGGGDTDLASINGGATTYDAASLSFTVVPNSNEISLSYLYGSEEYFRWNEIGYDDSFGVFVNGINCAFVPGTVTPVNAATISAQTNPSFFFQNFVGVDPAAGTYDTEFNGFTTTLTCTATVRANEPNTVKLVIGDTRDGQLDSTALFATGGLASTGTVVPIPTPTPTPTTHPTTVPAGNGGHRPTGNLSSTGQDLPVGAFAAAGLLLLVGGSVLGLRAMRRRSSGL